MNALHIRQLEAMGIRVWVPRAAAGTNSVEPLVPLSVSDGACVAVLVEVDDDFQLDAAHPAGDLLLNILGALKAPKGSLAVYRLAGQLTDMAVVERVLGRRPEAVLWFGGSPPVDGQGIVALPSLQRMLDDPGAKRPAWAQLKPLVGRIGGGGP